MTKGLRLGDKNEGEGERERESYVSTMNMQSKLKYPKKNQ
jgi:hypothetical protein